MKIPLATLIARAGTKRRTFSVQSYEPLRRDRDALLRIYLKVVRHWEGARARIATAYGWNISNMQDGMLYDSVGDLTGLIDQEGSWFTRIFVELREEIEAWTLATEAWQRGRWRGAVLSATGVDLDTMLYAGDVEQTLEAALEGNLALIKDVNEQQLSRMKEAVFRGLNQRLPARDVAKELQAITGFGRKRSIRIAGDQLSKLASALDRERQYQAGITQIEWVHSRKKHPRDWHVARNGKIYDLQTRKQVDGDEVIPANDMPGMQPFCGCRARAHLDLDAMERELDEQGL